MSPPKRPISQYQQLDTTVRVETPEKIAFQYQVIGPFRRLMAYALDLLIVGLAFLGCCVTIIVMFILLAWAMPWISGDFFKELISSSFGLLAIIAAVSFWFYGAVCETLRNGQTLGKQITHMRVISTDGSAIDGVQAMVRNLFRFLDIMPFIPTTIFFVFDFYEDAWGIPLFLAGLICMVASPRFQRIGDLVAGTMVVLVERDWAPELASFTDPRVEKLAEMIPNDFVVTPALAKALAAFVEATPRLGPAHSYEIAFQLAKPLMQKFGFPADIDPTLMLNALYFKTFSQFNTEDTAPVMAVAPVPVISAATSTVENIAAAPVAEDPFARQAPVGDKSDQSGAMNPQGRP